METAVIVLLIYIGGFFSGTTYEHSKQMEAEQVVAQVRQASQESAAAAIAKIEVKNQTVYQPVLESVRTEVKYTECKHDAPTVQRINEALTGVSTLPPTKTEVKK